MLHATLHKQRSHSASQKTMKQKKSGCKMNEKRSVCLFGLSADPPTGESGHVGVVQAILDMNEYDELYILPVFRHAFSKKRQRMISFEHRLAMCKAAFGKLTSSSSTTCKTTVIVSDLEKYVWLDAVKDIHDESQRNNITVGTAMLLEFLINKQLLDTQHECVIEYTFCLGLDAFLDLAAGKWKQSEKIISILNGRFLILYRVQNMIDQQYSTTSTTPNNHFLNDAYSSSDDTDTIDERIRINYPQAKYLQVEQLDDVSSTKVRECTNLSILSSMLSPPVLEYIQLHQLYHFRSPTSC